MFFKEAKLDLSWFGVPRFRPNLVCPVFVQVFWRFHSVFCPIFASRQSFRTWHGYFEKKSDQASFLWQFTLLKQKSATPQGLPPPTQQLEIPMQISWVGRSTNKMINFCWSPYTTENDNNPLIASRNLQILCSSSKW